MEHKAGRKNLTVKRIKHANIRKLKKTVQADSAMDASCISGCSACVLFQNEASWISQTSVMSASTMCDVSSISDNTYLTPFNGPYRLEDYSTCPGAGPAYSTRAMEPSVSPQPVPSHVTAKVIESFWESFETSVLYCKERSDSSLCQASGNTDSQRQSGSRTSSSTRSSSVSSRKDCYSSCSEYSTSSCDQVVPGVSNNSCQRLSPELPTKGKSNKLGVHSKRQPLVHQLTEYCSKKLASLSKKSQTVKEDKPKRKRFRKRKQKSKSVKLFGPADEEIEEEPSSSDQWCTSQLLVQLKTEIADLQCHGAELTKQMWLLYSTFEDFLKKKHPETAAGIKRYLKPDEWTSHGQHSQYGVDDADQGINATSLWVEEASHLHASVAETSDWLSPEEEYDDWSDDTDRVRKLSESDSEGEQSHISNNLQRHNASSGVSHNENHSDCMNLTWYTKVKKIDKSGSRNFRSRSRTPERQRNLQLQPVFPEYHNTSLEIETPIRRPEDLFGESCQWSENKGRGSPVTISSGYESDKDGVREADIDSILYGFLPGFKREGIHHTEMNVDGPSPPYMTMADPSQANRRVSSETFTLNSTERRSLDDLSSTDDSEITITEDTMVRPGLNRSKSLDDVLKENGVVFINPNAHSSLNKHGIHRSMNSISDLDAQQKLRMQAIAFANNDSDSDDNGASSVYENLPAALYAQVSPPKPHKVYKTPAHIGSNPLWESTPLDDKHKPRIMQNTSTASLSSQNLSSSASRDMMRKKAGLFFDDKVLNLTPSYKSAFRPYTKAGVPPIAEEIEKKLQEHSIAELRRVSGEIQNSPYLCMSQSRNSIVDQSEFPSSVLVDDISLQPANLDKTGALVEEHAAKYGQSSPPDSGRGSSNTSEQGSPPDIIDHNRLAINSINFPGFRMYKEESTLQDSFIDDTIEEEREPIYETIPSDIETVCKPQLRNLTNTTVGSEHIYCRIGEVPTLLDFSIPEPPPRGRDSQVKQTRNSSVPKSSGSSAHPASSRVVGPSGQVKQSDIVDINRYHTYTVGDILESFENYAGHLENHPKTRNNLYGLLADHLVRRKFSQVLKKDKYQHVEKVSSRGESSQQSSKRSSRVKVSSGAGKYHKQSSGSAGNTYANHVPRQVSQKSATLPSQKGKICDFTPGFTQEPPFENSGPMYTGQGVKLAAIKKTLSFQELSPNSYPSVQQNRADKSHQMSLPRNDKSFTEYNLIRPHSTTSNSMSYYHKRFSSDCTPTVIDGVQSYNTTPCDLTVSDAMSHSRIPILSPPSAFKGPSSSRIMVEEEDPVYENLRDIEAQRQNQQKSAAEHRRLPVTPLRRTHSALQIQWDGMSESREIFC